MFDELEQRFPFDLAAYLEVIKNLKKYSGRALQPQTIKIDWMPLTPRRNKQQPGLSERLIDNINGLAKRNEAYSDKEVRLFLILAILFDKPVYYFIYESETAQKLEKAEEILRLGIKSTYEFETPENYDHIKAVRKIFKFELWAITSARAKNTEHSLLKYSGKNLIENKSQNQLPQKSTKKSHPAGRLHNSNFVFFEQNEELNQITAREVQQGNYKLIVFAFPENNTSILKIAEFLIKMLSK